MIYLIVSLVAGLFFLISGKVKVGKAVYLEGSKARLAGLILIAPVIALLNTQSFLSAFISLIQSLSLILVIYLLVKPKWQFFE